MTSYFLWYNSSSHKKTRYFVGSESLPLEVQTPKGVMKGTAYKPAWTDEKEGATLFDDNGKDSGYAQGMRAKNWCEVCGYKDLVLEPIDEQKLPSKKITEKVQ